MALEGKSLRNGRYNVIKALGAGRFGTCWLADDTADDTQMVLKQVFIGMLPVDETVDAQAEARLLERLKHPNILMFHDAFLEDQFMFMATEYCEGGDLATYIVRTREEKQVIPERQVMNWFVQLSLALRYMHERQVLHRDLKTNNIFLKKGFIKLGDFGIARVLQSDTDQATTFAGTPYYMSPEVLQSKGYNAKSDIWSLGCVVIELCLLQQAFNGESGLLGLMFEICEGEVPTLPATYSKELRDTVAKLLSRDPSKRPDAQEILAFPFIAMQMQGLREELSQTQVGREAVAIRGVATKKKHRKASTASTDPAHSTASSTSSSTATAGVSSSTTSCSACSSSSTSSGTATAAGTIHLHTGTSLQ